ncbi:MAG: 23S rRNA (guanosine(2251)-2'-O)-methyltransferase RlmB [Nitrospirae bacterium]|nr:23S rRNA (guanosine(2251)-2'-O)-methyltransferase RlmB [Nitrospirota bacterium]
MTYNSKTTKEEWIYGINPLLEAIRGGAKIKSVCISLSRQRNLSNIKQKAEEAGLTVVFKDENFFDKMFPKGHQGVAALILQKGYIEFDELLKIPERKKEHAFFLILDCIEDPRNFGAILRTAEAAGVHGVIIPSHKSAGLSPLVYKASAGAVEYIPVAQVSNLKHAIEALKKEGVWVYGADMEGKETLWDMDFTYPMAVVLGSEGSGIRRTVKEHCDHIFKIPLTGNVASLNVSVAAGVLIFEILRQRQGK